MQETAADTIQLVRRGRQLPEGMTVKGLEPILCWKCERAIGYGGVLVVPGGAPLVLKCMRNQCGEKNYFGERGGLTKHPDGANMIADR